jgi:ribosomal protein S18 acetylase RimI-like enzyme
MQSRFRLVRPDEALAMRALRVLIGGPERAPEVPLRGTTGEIQHKLKGFLTYAATIHLQLTRQVIAFVRADGTDADGAGGARADDVIAGTCLWVPSAGRTAMLFAPALSEFPEAAAAVEQCVRAALQDARTADVNLVQVMLEPADAAGKTVFASAGLTQLATLTYMERRPPLQPPVYELPPGIRLEPYSAATHAQFRTAIAESYDHTMDCPQLSGLRDVEDVIAGHKAVGPFDPNLWSLLLEGDQPAGCLLLSEIPARRGLELVYLGLSPRVRGRGLGRILMLRVLGIASRRNMDVATLAVDAANTPAVRLYRRCGYVNVAQRVAMIKRLG